MIDVCLLGVGGTMPMPGRPLSGVLLRAAGGLILIDCGEGMQVSLRKLGWGLRDIHTILLTHFHADHVAGLPGLLLTIGNSGRGRDEPVLIVGPRGVQRVTESLRIIAPKLPFPIRYRELTEPHPEPFAAGPLTLHACAADHEIPCYAYRADLSRAPAFLPEKAKAIGLPVTDWKKLQRGETVPYGDRLVLPEEVLGPPRPGIAFTFITDSRPTAPLADFAAESDLLICEGTYGDPEDRPKAIENKHMTFTESATLARAAGAKRLWLTHFTTAMPYPEGYRQHAEAVFPGAVVGRQFLWMSLRFAEDAPDEPKEAIIPIAP